MTRRRIGLAGIILLMLAIGIWAVLPKHESSSGSVAKESVTYIPVHAAQVPGSLAVAKPAVVSGLWTRPPAKVAARNARRVRFATLRRFGASDKIVDRLTDGDIQTVILELKQQAQLGSVSAANTLQYMARFNCEFARVNGERTEPRARELLDAQALPEQDAAWIRNAIEEKNIFDEQLAGACEAIDRKEVQEWVNKAADQGDPASLYLRYLFRGNQVLALSLHQLDQAVDAGYPEAQAMLAQRMSGGAPGLPPDGKHAEPLYKEAAVSLPYAESLLAVCEFSGCPGVEADIPSAVAHAREAAQRGSFDAMIEIGPKLQASQIDPDEVAAWNQVGSMLAQQGCSTGGLTIQNMTSWTSALTSKTTSGKAKSLAEQYWREFGQQMMSNIGCAQ